MAQKKTSKRPSRKSSSGSSAGRSGTGTRSGSSSASPKRTSASSGRSKNTGTSGSRNTSRGGAKQSGAVNRAIREREEREREIRMDIALIVLLIGMVFLYLSLFGFCGNVGTALGKILFGLFGIGAWGIPAWTFLLCLFLVSRAGGSKMPVRLGSLALLLLILESAGHLYLHFRGTIALEAGFFLKQTFALCADRQAGGGIIGGWTASLMFRAFGAPGSVLVYIGAAVIALILLLQRSPAGAVRQWRRRREEEGIPGFAERRAIHRQRRLEELEREEEEELEREAERILRREEKAEEIQALRRSEHRPEKGGRKTPRTLDLESTLLGYRPRSGGGMIKGNADPAAAKGLHTVPGPESRSLSSLSMQGSKDVHEIILTDIDQGLSPILTSSEQVIPGLRSGIDRSPEPGGTTYRRPDSNFEGPELGDGINSRTDTSLGPVGDDSKPDRTKEQYPGLSVIEGRQKTRPAVETIHPDTPSAEVQAPVSVAGNKTAAGNTTSQSTSGQPDPIPAPSEADLSSISVHREKGTAKKAGGRTAVSRRGSTYVPPTFNLLTKETSSGNDKSELELKKTAYRLQETLRSFGVQVSITDISQGPSVTRYELTPDQGVKVSKIVNLSNDIKLRLAATDIRIEAPIPGKSAIGIEVPNKHKTTVYLRELLESREFRRFEGRLPFVVGKDIGGKIIIEDIARMPHLLIAGATGSGKSVCINTIILSLLYRTTPENVRLLLIDPKMVELSLFKGIPHLIIPVVTDVRKASAALNWAIAEMEKRYKMFAAVGVRDINGYNALAKAFVDENGEPEREPLPRLVIIVDELADLMMVAKNDVETAICRLTQLSRAAGIHLIIATQRPSVDVITGLIKANMPSRIAFSVSSQVDSRTILDMAGAEKLIGSGDMLFLPVSYPKPARMQGAFVSDKDVNAVVDYIREHNKVTRHDEDIDRQIDEIAVNGMPDQGSG